MKASSQEIKLFDCQLADGIVTVSFDIVDDVQITNVNHFEINYDSLKEFVIKKDISDYSEMYLDEYIKDWLRQCVTLYLEDQLG